MENQSQKIIFRGDKETLSLIAAGKKAAQKAIRENRVLGLTFTYTKGNKVFKEQSNGEVVFVKSILSRKQLHIKKGTILYVKSK
ncbi:hypothetical protein [Flavobacterium sp.]|uniref:hypothetical protein n=1 Tax=Flavobacterium sp. TaxID=239 RepID=UPI00375304D2